MKEWIEEAIVLRVGHFREIDLWLKLLLPKTGLLSSFAFGGSRSRHRFPGCLDVFNTLKGHFAQRKGQFYTLEEADLVRSPANLRKNWTNTGIVANCVRFLEAVGIGEENSEQSYALMQETISLGDGESALSAVFPVFFRFHLACRIGYMPHLLHCVECGRELLEKAFFHVQDGYVFCAQCHGQIAGRFSSSSHTVALFPRELELLDHVAHTLPSAWNFSYSRREEEVCAKIIDDFIRYHLGIIWEHGTFRKI